MYWRGVIKLRKVFDGLEILIIKDITSDDFVAISRFVFKKLISFLWWWFVDINSSFIYKANTRNSIIWVAENRKCKRAKFCINFKTWSFQGIKMQLIHRPSWGKTLYFFFIFLVLADHKLLSNVNIKIYDYTLDCGIYYIYHCFGFLLIFHTKKMIFLSTFITLLRRQIQCLIPIQLMSIIDIFLIVTNLLTILMLKKNSEFEISNWRRKDS